MAQPLSFPGQPPTLSRMTSFARPSGISPARLRGVDRFRRLTLPLLEAVPDLAHAFTVSGSDPADVLCEEMGDGTPLHTMRQVHGAGVHIVERADCPGEPPSQTGDALVSDLAGLALGVRVADCVPILMCDERTRALAAVHAGWRGTLAGVLPATITMLRERFGARPDQLRLAFGPAIGPCCFEVGHEVVEALLQSDPGATACVLEGRRRRIDLIAASQRQAVAAGVRRDRMQSADLCTACRADLLPSHRRTGGAPARMTALIGWRS